jgi:hypothetical protein
MMTATPNDVEHRKTKHKCKQRLVIYLIFDIKTIRADFEFQKRFCKRRGFFTKKQFDMLASQAIFYEKRRKNK